MNFFKDSFSDLAEMGSNKSKFKKKFTALSKLLSDFSFGVMQYSQELERQKIIVAYNELIEFGQITNKQEIIKIYFPDRSVDLSIEAAIIVADLWTNAILEDGVQFTNSFAIRIIERVKNEMKIKLADSFNTEKLKERFTTLLSLFKETSANIKEMYLVIDTAQQFEYRFPILTYGRTMGYYHWGLRKLYDINFEFYCYAISENKEKRIDATSKIIMEDLDEKFYAEHISSMMKEIFNNPLIFEISVIR
jgi:hypothetical protein